MNRKKDNALYLTAISHKAILLLSLAGMWGCVQKPASPPNHVMDMPTFVEVMIEAHLIEGARTGNRVMGGDTMFVQDFYYTALHNRGVDTTLFRKSLDWYTRNPDFLIESYKLVLDSLEKLEVKAQKEFKAREEERMNQMPKEEVDSMMNIVRPKRKE